MLLDEAGYLFWGWMAVRETWVDSHLQQVMMMMMMMMMMMTMTILILSLVLIPWSCFVFLDFLLRIVPMANRRENHDWTLSGMRPVEVEQRLSGGSFWQRETWGPETYGRGKVCRKCMK